MIGRAAGTSLDLGIDTTLWIMKGLIGSSDITVPQAHLPNGMKSRSQALGFCEDLLKNSPFFHDMIVLSLPVAEKVLPPVQTGAAAAMS